MLIAGNHMNPAVKPGIIIRMHLFRRALGAQEGDLRVGVALQNRRQTLGGKLRSLAGNVAADKSDAYRRSLL
ncbi:hypothetical protein D3C71_1913030 [compost metagenome]